MCGPLLADAAGWGHLKILKFEILRAAALLAALLRSRLDVIVSFWLKSRERERERERERCGDVAA